MLETTKFALFKWNRGYMPSMLQEIRSDLVIPKGIKDFAAQALKNLAAAHNAIIKAHVFQTCNTNQCRSASPDIQKGTLVYLSTKNLTLLAQEKSIEALP